MYLSFKNEKNKFSKKVEQIKSWNVKSKRFKKTHNHFSNFSESAWVKIPEKKKKRKKKTYLWQTVSLGKRESVKNTTARHLCKQTIPHPFGSRKLPCSPTDHHQTSNAEDRITEVAGSADPCRLFVLVA